MTRILDKDLQNLRNLLIALFAKVEEMVKGATLALKTCDLELARKVVKNDDEVDDLAIHIFEYANTVIALKQPTAKDLRVITSSINLAKDLERIADQAVNLAETVPSISEEKINLERLAQVIGKDVEDMEKLAIEMLASAINAFLYPDLELARRIIQKDALVDHLYKRIKDDLTQACLTTPELFKTALTFFRIIENLERIADLSTNICEEVFFIEKGERLRTAEFLSLEEEKRTPLPLTSLLGKISQNLKSHITLVFEALQRVPLALEAFKSGNKSFFEEVKQDILEIENKADQVKRNIRGHLPKGLILPVDKFEIFQYLKEADSLADFAEEFLLLLDMNVFKLPEDLLADFEYQLDFAISQASKLPEILELTIFYLYNNDEQSREKAKELIRSIRTTKNEFIRKAYEIKQKLYTKTDITLPFQAIYYYDIENKIITIMERIENSADLLRAMIAKV